MSEEIKNTIRRLWDVWNSRELDQLGDLIAENHVNHDPNNPTDLVGVDGYRELSIPEKNGSTHRRNSSRWSKSLPRLGERAPGMADARRGAPSVSQS